MVHENPRAKKRSEKRTKGYEDSSDPRSNPPPSPAIFLRHLVANLTASHTLQTFRLLPSSRYTHGIGEIFTGTNLPVSEAIRRGSLCIELLERKADDPATFMAVWISASSLEEMPIT